MLHDLLDWILPACKLGLEDADDDVRAVAADAMIPTAAAIISLKGETLHSIIMLLWDILLDLDDLSPSTSRYVDPSFVAINFADYRTNSMQYLSCVCELLLHFFF